MRVTVDNDREKKEKEIKALWNRFIISAVFAVPLLLIAMGPMIAEKLNYQLPSIIDPMAHPEAYAILQLILVIPVMITGKKYFIVGFKSLVRLSPNMDSLISIGTSAAFLYSLFAVYQIMFMGNVDYAMYFESAGVILTLITLGKYLESVTKGKTSEAIKKLMGLAPKTAIIIRDNNEIEISIDEVEVGDIVVVRPCAFSTKVIICARAVSFPTLVALYLMEPFLLILAPIILSPSFFSTGMLSPVSIDSSTDVMPSTTSPSTGIFSPGLTTTMSPTSTSSIEISISLLFLMIIAVLGASPISFLIASEVFPFVTDSKYLPKVISVKITPADSKYIA